MLRAAFLFSVIIVASSGSISDLNMSLRPARIGVMVMSRSSVFIESYMFLCRSMRFSSYLRLKLIICVGISVLLVALNESVTLVTFISSSYESSFGEEMTALLKLST